MTEQQKEKMRLQARMFDMGHAPKERVVNRVMKRAGETAPTDDRLHEMLADEKTQDEIQDLYS